MRNKSFLILIFISLLSAPALAQENFYIKDFEIAVQVRQDASIHISEKISVHFLQPMHGIYRKIPFRYELRELPGDTEKADIPWEHNGYRYTKVKDIDVKHFDTKIESANGYKIIRIGSPDKEISGDQVYEISYTILGAINFFKDHAELYLNLTGNEWDVKIEKAHFTISLYKPLPDTPAWFVATGATGSRENLTNTKWKNNQLLEGSLTSPLLPYQGITVGVKMPETFLVKPDYKMMGKGWMLLPVGLFVIMFLAWKKWGKDLPVTLQTTYYPPDKISPSVAGYVIDGKLDRKDLTALIPYWGAGGFLKVNELEKKKLLGLIKDTEYEFIKVKDLNEDAEMFEKTMFNGLFKSGDKVQLDDLKNSFYTTMNNAKSELQTEIRKEHYYTTYSRAMSVLLPIIGVIFLILSIVQVLINYPLDLIPWVSVAVASVFIIIFGSLMTKKTVKGTELYERLLGFKEFIKSVEKDRLKEFLKQDPEYFDKVLPFAIVFDVADTWKDKLKGLDVPPPSWYSGYYPGNTFNTMLFMNSLDHSLARMGQTFYSAPSSSSGSSGGSFGGGGFSGGGFGGGGGGGW